MNVGEARAVFVSYSMGEKADFLAQLMYELTIVMRDAYEVGSDGLTDPPRARRINETQHRVSAFLWAILRNDPKRFPDDVFISIILEQPDDPGLAQALNETFARLTAQRLTAA